MIPVLRIISSGSRANSNSNVRTNVNKRALILRKSFVRRSTIWGAPRHAFASERRDYMIDALGNREAVAYAGVRTRNKRHQVSIDARKPIHRIGNIIPSLRPAIFLPVKTYNMIKGDTCAYLNSFASSPHTSVERFNNRIGMITKSPLDTLLPSPERKSAPPI